MNRIAVLLAAALAASFFVPAEAWAQGSIVQTGNAPTQGHVPIWWKNGVVGDAGGVGANTPGAGVTELPIVNETIAQPQCFYDAKPWRQSAYHQFCLGAGLNGTPQMTFGSVGAAPLQGLNIEVNGVIYPFPGPGSGNVLGPPSTAVTEISSFNNTLGTLLRQGRAKITDGLTGPIAPGSEGTSILGQTQGGFTAQQIADWVFCNGCTDPVSVDGMRGIGILTPSSTIDLVNGVGGYVMAQAPLSGPFPTSVALFGMGIADANGSSVWGINTAVTDNRGQAVSAGTGRQLFNEFDLNFTSPNSTGIGIQVAGASLSDPQFALGIVCSNLSQSNFSIRWDTCFYSGDGVAGNAVIAGKSAVSGTSLQSQNYTMVMADSFGVTKTISFSGQPDQSVLFGNTDGKITFLGGAGLDSSNIAAPFAINIGKTALTGTSVASQGVQFNVLDAGGVARTVALAAQPNQGILFANSGGAPVTLSGINAVMGNTAGINVSAGELGFNKMSASGVAAGSGGGKIEMVCGTNAGTLKIIAYGGTSTTPVTITDNIGAGATGC